MALLYYSRMRMILNLLPLLLASTLPAHIVSVYAAGLEKQGKLQVDDLALLQREHYSFANCRTNCIYMKTMFMERLAREHPGKLSLNHVFPSIVVTPNYRHPSYPAWLKIIWGIVGPLVTRFASVDREESGERTLFLASSRYPARKASGGIQDDHAQSKDVAMSTDGVRGGGAYSCNYDGETNDVARYYVDLRKQGFEDKVWKHTMKVFSEIEAGKAFKG